MKLLINTQYKENYAWGNDDYVHGVSDPYWKYKGGSAYVLENVGDEVLGSGDEPNLNGYDILHRYFPEVVKAISVSDDAQQEYVIDVQLLANPAPLAIEEWDNPYFINIDSDGSITCERNTANGEFGWMREECMTPPPSIANDTTPECTRTATNNIDNKPTPTKYHTKMNINKHNTVPHTAPAPHTRANQTNTLHPPNELTQQTNINSNARTQEHNTTCMICENTCKPTRIISCRKHPVCNECAISARSFSLGHS